MMIGGLEQLSYENRPRELALFILGKIMLQGGLIAAHRHSRISLHCQQTEGKHGKV